MYDKKTIDEAQAKVEAGEKAKEFLATVGRQQRSDRASDLEGFKSLKPVDRTQLFRDDPDRYQALAKQWQDELERSLLDKGGR